MLQTSAARQQYQAELIKNCDDACYTISEALGEDKPGVVDYPLVTFIKCEELEEMNTVLDILSREKELCTTPDVLSINSPVKQNPIEHFKQTVDSPTLVLVDMAFLSSELKIHREDYADIYPSKTLPTKISETTLINALCKYIRVQKDKATFFIFQQSFDTDVLDDKQGNLVKHIRCNEPTYFEMVRIIESAPEIHRVVIMADDRGYVPPISMLLRKGYAVGLIKHRQENDSDESQMPPELPYQFSDYVVGECLGLRADEL